MPDALQMLKDDHRKVQDIFKRFEQAEDEKEKKALVDEALNELDIHAELEEEIFYPAVREESTAEEDTMDEAEEEHHVVHVLIAELRKMRPSAKNYDAKFTVLAENVKHHIQEEETEMLPRAAELGSERMQEIGEEMFERKQELMARGFPRSGSRGRSTNGRRTTRRTPAPRGRTRTSTGGTRSRTATRSRAATRAGTRSAGTRRSAASRGGRARAASTRTRSTTSRSGRSGSRSRKS